MSLNLRRLYSEDEQQNIYSNASRRQYSESERSDDSNQSNSTAPTDHSFMPIKLNSHHETSFDGTVVRWPGVGEIYTGSEQEAPFQSTASIDTYASTIPSFDDLEDTVPEYQVPPYQPDMYLSNALPATPRDFAELFPSTRRLEIAHDESTSDGNMNLRVDTQVIMSSGRTQPITLFHLRMYDLKKRGFSLRRYDRDSGREVCHAERKHQKTPTEKRPGFSRSLSNALAALRAASSKTVPTMSALKRTDSGYGSLNSCDGDMLDTRPKSADMSVKSRPTVRTNTTKIDFANYAQVELTRRGTGRGKRYEFEYWGRTYQWRRELHETETGKQCSYHLYAEGGDQPLAHVAPMLLSPGQVVEEQSKGGWVPPCSMWISDESLCLLQNDVSDVIVASGLITLLDDCIKRRFHSRHSRRLHIPMSKFKLEGESIGPKRIIEKVLTRPSSSRSKSPRPALIQWNTRG